MAKDKLGLEWKEKNSDDSLYTAMIWALSIGIIIVIATLFLTRPAPEKFTEIYFNNHTSLPEYYSLGTKVPYSFTIHNLEHNNITYNYSITAYLYRLDYNCTTPVMYLEPMNNSRITQTDDPELYIKDIQYGVSFQYDMKSGNYMMFGIKDINENLKYAIIIDHDKNILVFISGNSSQAKSIKLSDNIHRVDMRVSSLSITIRVDNQEFVFNTPRDYTKGYPYIETQYADIHNMRILRNSTVQNVIVRIADTKTENIVLKTVNITRAPLSQNNPDMTIRQYYTQTPINTSSHTLRLRLYSNNYSMDVAGITISQDNKKVVVSRGNISREMTLNRTTTLKDLGIIFKNNTARISLDSANIFNITQGISTSVPKITIYDEASIRDFTVRSNIEPITYLIEQDNIPQQTYANTYSEKAIASLIAPQNRTMNDSGINNTELLQSILDNEMLSWTDYRISATYVDYTMSDTLKLSLMNESGTIYSIFVNPKRTALRYGNTYIPIDTNIGMNTRLGVEVSQGLMRITINEKEILNATLRDYTGGIIVTDYEDIILTGLQVENIKTGEIIVYEQNTQLQCNPILIKSIMQQNNITMMHGQSNAFNNYIKFDDQFDIARIKVGIAYYKTIEDKGLFKKANITQELNDGQEIHFIVRQT